MDSALTAWKAFDLSESQKLVDEQALQMVDNDQTSNERKLALLEKTKAYGLLPVEEKIQSVLPLLKAYQGEITSLTKRAKFSESSFLHIFKALSILPDPVVYLEQGLSDSHRILNFEAEKVKDSHRISFLESENVDLKNLLEQYANELKASKYMEAGLRSLEERNKELEHKVQQFSSRQIHEQKLTTELVELSHNYAEKEGLLLTQLDNIKGTLTSTIVGHQIKEKEYFQTIQTIESKRAAKDAEADHLAGELDRATSEVHILRTQNNSMHQEISHLRSLVDSERPGQNFLPDPNFDLVVSQLQESVFREENKSRELTARLLKVETSSTEDLNKLAYQCQSFQQKIEELERSLEERPLKEEFQRLQRQLALMTAAHDSSLDSFQTHSSEYSEAELTLLRHTRSLETDLTSTKAQLRQIKVQCDELSRALEAANDEGSRAQALVVRLEADLYHLASTKRSESRSEGSDSGGDKQRVSGLADIPLLKSPSRRFLNSEGESNVHLEQGSGVVNVLQLEHVTEANSKSTLLSVIIGQRDRLKQNLDISEQANFDLQNKLASISRDMSTLKSENLQLFSRLKDVRAVDKSYVGSETRVEIKYDQIYQASSNPFIKLQERQEISSYNQLDTSEKCVYWISKLLYNKKAARTFVFFYMILLHMFIFGNLWKHTISPHC